MGEDVRIGDIIHTGNSDNSADFSQRVEHILTTLTPGQVIEIYRTTTDKLAVKRTEDGTEENIFALLDEDSDLLELAPGDNLLKATADSGETSLQVTVRFYPMVSGILPEVIS